ncbi:MAG: PaaI family thioesterase [Crocinitomicaceae bacterium]|nr:PaaI family thioesterase [Crocinitomicaceae bacterium]
MQNHFDHLEHIYSIAPIHEFYKGISLIVEDGKATIHLEINSSYFHAGQSTHGSVYFKLLDDAAYFAVQSKVTDKFILTSTFNIQLFRPVTKGKIIAQGSVDLLSRNIFTASSKLFDEDGKLCAQGTGQFMKSPIDLDKLG